MTMLTYLFLYLIVISGIVIAKQDGLLFTKDTVFCIPKGHHGLRQEIWKYVDGRSLFNLEQDFRYPGFPTSVHFLANFEDPGGRGNEYGQRLSGHFIPPLTGNYTFYMSCDDRCELSISADHVALNSRPVIRVERWTKYRRWKKNRSAPIYLSAGGLHYIQALMVQGYGGDHVSVGAKFPDGTYNRPLARKYLVQYVPGRSYNIVKAEWGNWSPCGVTCGKGTQYRNRTCKDSAHTKFKKTGQQRQTRLCPGMAPCAGPPKNVRAIRTGSTSILVTWAPQMNHIVGYTVSYNILPIYATAPRRRRALNHETENPDKGHVTVAKDVSSVALLGLRPYRDYRVRVATLTTDGQSLVSADFNVKTDQAAPSAAPTDIQAKNKTSPHKFILRWDSVPLSDRNGIILGYIILVRAISTADKRTKYKKEFTRKVLAPRMNELIPGLETYTTYSVRVAAFTVKGTGPYSDPLYVETCRCPKRFYTNWWPLPPLTINASAHAPQGSFIYLVENFIDQACGVCHQHRKTDVKFGDSGTNTIAAQKKSIRETRSQIQGTADLSFPLTVGKGQVVSDGHFTFAPVFAMTSSIVYFRKEISAEVFAKMVGSSVFKCWPVLLVMLALSQLAGFVIWALDTRANPAHFPTSFPRGPLEGAWCAFISMASVGYGDRLPKTYPARVFIIMWVLVGIVIWSIFLSTVTSLLNVSVQMETRNPESSATIGVIEGSVEFRIAKKINGTKGTNCIGFTTQEDMVAALKNGKLDGVLLDAIGAARRDYPLPSTGLKHVKVYDLTYYYGVFMKGDAAKLGHLLKEYLVENPFVLENDTINAAGPSAEPETTPSPAPKPKKTQTSFFDPKNPMFVKAMRFLCGFLIGAFLCGICYQINRKRNPGCCRTRRKDLISNSNCTYSLVCNLDSKQLQEELRQIVQQFYTNCKGVKKSLEEKHRKEKKVFFHAASRTNQSYKSLKDQDISVTVV